MLRILIFFGFALFIFPGRLCAQEMPFTENKSWDEERYTWKASWITHPDESVFDHGVFLFRNSFTLKLVPSKFIIYISADNRYRLFVNGKYVTLGPARGSLMNWHYETLDIGPYLKYGENIIAVEVVNFGQYRPAAQFSHMTAMIFQADTLGDVINTGIGAWKVIRDGSFFARPVTQDMTLGKYYVAGPCDSIVANRHPWGWQESRYSTENWARPKIIQRGVGRGYMHGTAWMLVPREIPLMEEKIKRFSFIARHEGAPIKDEFLLGESSTYIPPNSSMRVLLDQLHLTTCYPVLKTSGGKDSQVRITYAEALFDSDGKKGNRNMIKGKEIKGYSDIIIPDGGDNRIFKTTWIRTYRYVELDISTGEDPLFLHDFYGVFTAYPFEKIAEFNPNNELLNQIWEVGWRTARLCANETYMDCPYWEQLQYIGDTRIQALISLNVANDDLLMRNAIEQADQSRIPDGLTLSRGPSYIPQIIPVFSLYWVAMVHDYFMYRKDDNFIKERLAGIQAVLGWFERRIDTNGMMGGLEWFNFADWTQGFPVGTPPGADSGNSALVSFSYLYALQKAADLFDYFDEGQQADRYRALAAKIRKSTIEMCYNEDKGIFADSPEQNSYSQHTNIFAILSDAIDKDDQRRIMSRIIDDPTLIQTSIYYKFYLFEALYKTGLGDKYLSMLQSWEQMLQDGLTTFAEGDYKDRSDCHAWSASPLYHFISLVAGVRPNSPGYGTVMIQPNLGSLRNLKAKIPHPSGNIILDLKKDGENLTGTIDIPDSIKGDFTWNEKKIKLKPGKNYL